MSAPSFEMSPAQAESIIGRAYDANVPCMLHGAPGIGKSAIARAVAVARGVPCKVIRLNLIDPVDLRGVPYVRDGRTHWARPDILPADSDGPEGLLFLDELPHATPLVQTSVFGLLVEREIGEHKLPAGWRMIAAGNRTADKSAANRIPAALANRLLHIDMRADLQDWSRWAITNGIAPVLVAFLRFRPELFCDFQPTRRENPTPRIWESVARILPVIGADPALDLPTLAGLVGHGPAAELLGFLRLYKSLPSPDAILADPAGAAVPSDPATLYALVGALSRKATAANAGRVLQYGGRLPADFGALLAIDSVRRCKDIQTTSAWTQWSALHGDVLL